MYIYQEMLSLIYLFIRLNANSLPWKLKLFQK